MRVSEAIGPVDVVTSTLSDAALPPVVDSVAYVVRAEMLAVPEPVAVARLKPPVAASLTVKPLTMPLVSKAADGTLMTIWLVALPSVWPLPATRLAVAPALRPTRLAVRATAAPVPEPAVVWIVEWPVLNRTVPRVSVEATPAPLLPR